MERLKIKLTVIPKKQKAYKNLCKKLNSRHEHDGQPKQIHKRIQNHWTDAHTQVCSGTEMAACETLLSVWGPQLNPGYIHRNLSANSKEWLVRHQEKHLFTDLARCVVDGAINLAMINVNTDVMLSTKARLATTAEKCRQLGHHIISKQCQSHVPINVDYNRDESNELCCNCLLLAMMAEDTCADENAANQLTKAITETSNLRSDSTKAGISSKQDPAVPYPNDSSSRAPPDMITPTARDLQSAQLGTSYTIGGSMIKGTVGTDDRSPTTTAQVTLPTHLEASEPGANTAYLGTSFTVGPDQSIDETGHALPTSMAPSAALGTSFSVNPTSDILTQPLTKEFKKDMENIDEHPDEPMNPATLPSIRAGHVPRKTTPEEADDNSGYDTSQEVNSLQMSPSVTGPMDTTQMETLQFDTGHSGQRTLTVTPTDEYMQSATPGVTDEEPESQTQPTSHQYYTEPSSHNQTRVPDSEPSLDTDSILPELPHDQGYQHDTQL